MGEGGGTQYVEQTIALVEILSCLGWKPWEFRVSSISLFRHLQQWQIEWKPANHNFDLGTFSDP